MLCASRRKHRRDASMQVGIRKPYGGTCLQSLPGHNCKSIVVTVLTKENANQISWTIPEVGIGVSPGYYRNNHVQNMPLCLPPGTYSLVLANGFDGVLGNGWNGASITISLKDGFMILPLSTLTAGSSVVLPFAVPGSPNSGAQPIIGTQCGLPNTGTISVDVITKANANQISWTLSGPNGMGIVSPQGPLGNGLYKNFAAARSQMFCAPAGLYSLTLNSSGNGWDGAAIAVSWNGTPTRLSVSTLKSSESETISFELPPIASNSEPSNTHPSQPTQSQVKTVDQLSQPRGTVNQASLSATIFGDPSNANSSQYLSSKASVFPDTLPTIQSSQSVQSLASEASNGQDMVTTVQHPTSTLSTPSSTSNDHSMVTTGQSFSSSQGLASKVSSPFDVTPTVQNSVNSLSSHQDATNTQTPGSPKDLECQRLLTLLVLKLMEANPSLQDLVCKLVETNPSFQDVLCMLGDIKDILSYSILSRKHLDRGQMEVVTVLIFILSKEIHFGHLLNLPTEKLSINLLPQGGSWFDTLVVVTHHMASSEVGWMNKLAHRMLSSLYHASPSTENISVDASVRLIQLFGVYSRQLLGGDLESAPLVDLVLKIITNLLTHHFSSNLQLVVSMLFTSHLTERLENLVGGTGEGADVPPKLRQSLQASVPIRVLKSFEPLFEQHVKAHGSPDRDAMLTTLKQENLAEEPDTYYMFHDVFEAAAEKERRTAKIVWYRNLLNNVRPAVQEPSSVT